LPKGEIKTISLLNNLLATYSELHIEIFLFDFELGIELSSLDHPKYSNAALGLVIDLEAKAILSFNKEK